MHKAGAVVVGLLGAWVFYLFVQHLRGESLRYHAEAAAVWFVAAGVLLVLSTRDPHGRPAADRSRRVATPVALWLAFVLAAFALYWPTAGIGLLSDDFLLWDRAAGWNLSPVSSGLFRPLPLLVWALLVNAGASALALHALNVFLHGTNAYLTTRLCAGWLGAGTSAALAGALMIAMPLASEPVSWPSGIFDLSMTALTLVFVLRGRTYDGHVTLAQRAGFIAIGVCAMGAKETGVMASLLVLVDAWIRSPSLFELRWASRRALLMDTAIVLAIATSFSAIRILGAFGLKSPSLSRYRVQRSLFETFGGLTVPFHADVVQHLPWLPPAAVLIVVALFIWYFVATGRRSDRFLFGGAAWILISVLPVFLFVFVAQDLQGARFLYLAGPAWTSLLAGLALSAERVDLRRITISAAVILAVLWAVAARVQMSPWIEAARLRDEVLQSAKSDQLMRQCQGVLLMELPDNVRGAYLFRNGVPEAFLRDAGIHVGDRAAPECRFRWNEPARTFSRAPE
jgi:hypothetical protein